MFDLGLTEVFVENHSLEAKRTSSDCLIVKLTDNYSICFENDWKQADTFIYFQNFESGWHSHGDLFLEDNSTIDLVPAEILQSLINGDMLISKLVYATGKVQVRLEYSQRNYDLAYLLGKGERQEFIRI